MPATQLCILISAALAIALISSSAPGSGPHRVGCWVGLAGQPCWLADTLYADQFGMFTVSLWFTGVYLAGIFRRPPSKQPSKQPRATS